MTGSVVLCPVTRSPPFRLVSCCDVVSRTIHGANYRTGIQVVKYCERVESEAENDGYVFISRGVLLFSMFKVFKIYFSIV